MIKFVKLNETFIKIVCEKSVLLEISKQFEYTQKNYQYTPQARKGWDGIIKMISTRNGNFLSGLLKEVILKFKELGYNEFTFEGFDNAKSEYTENGVLSALDEFKLKDDSGSGIEIREHQLNAILTCLCGMRRIIESPTASGKSLIIYSIIRILIESGKKILLITPNSVLVDQLLNDFKQYEQYDDFGIENYTHKVYAGHEKTSNKQLVISTWQSCNLVSKETLESYDCVLVDETHTATAKVLKGIIEDCINAKYKFGFTGTLSGGIIPQLVMLGLFGTAKKVISIKELMDKGLVAKLKIKCIVLEYPEHIKKLVSGMEYDDELNTIIGYENRNRFIANLADKIEGNTLIIIRFIEKHADVLKSYIDAKNNKITYLLTGDTKNDEKTLVKEHMETVTNTNLMGSWGLVSTGMSIINLNNGIWASPSVSEIRVKQAIGRLLRKGKNKDSAIQYDIVDNLTYEGNYNHLMRHFKKRIQYYRNEGFDYEIIKVKIS